MWLYPKYEPKTVSVKFHYADKSGSFQLTAVGGEVKWNGTPSAADNLIFWKVPSGCSASFKEWKYCDALGNPTGIYSGSWNDICEEGLHFIPVYEYELFDLTFVDIHGGPISAPAIQVECGKTFTFAGSGWTGPGLAAWGFVDPYVFDGWFYICDPDDGYKILDVFQEFDKPSIPVTKDLVIKPGFVPLFTVKVFAPDGTLIFERENIRKGQTIDLYDDAYLIVKPISLVWDDTHFPPGTKWNGTAADLLITVQYNYGKAEVVVDRDMDLTFGYYIDCLPSKNIYPSVSYTLAPLQPSMIKVSSIAEIQDVLRSTNANIKGLVLQNDIDFSGKMVEFNVNAGLFNITKQGFIFDGNGKKITGTFIEENIFYNDGRKWNTVYIINCLANDVTIKNVSLSTNYTGAVGTSIAGAGRGGSINLYKCTGITIDNVTSYKSATGITINQSELALLKQYRAYDHYWGQGINLEDKEGNTGFILALSCDINISDPRPIKGTVLSESLGAFESCTTFGWVWDVSILSWKKL